MCVTFSKVFNPKSGWYCGDFHVHTNASIDGDYPPTVVAGIARAEGLDFTTITDHNTIEGFSELDENLGFPIIPGIEVALAGVVIDGSKLTSIGDQGFMAHLAK